MEKYVIKFSCLPKFCWYFVETCHFSVFNFYSWHFLINKSWRQHPTRLQLYGHLPPITKTIQVRRTRHAGHCWRSKDELISDVLLWTPTHGCARVGRPARTYIQQLCEDTGCNPEDLPEAMNDREKWRETVRDIRAGGATWWWWWYIYIYIYIYAYISSSASSNHTDNTDLWLSFSIHSHHPILLAGLLDYIQYPYWANVCKSMCKNPYEKVAYEFFLIFPAVLSMSCSYYLNCLWVERQVAIQLLFYWMLVLRFVQNSSQHSCVVLI